MHVKLECVILVVFRMHSANLAPREGTSRKNRVALQDRVLKPGPVITWPIIALITDPISAMYLELPSEPVHETPRQRFGGQTVPATLRCGPCLGDWPIPTPGCRFCCVVSEGEESFQ